MLVSLGPRLCDLTPPHPDTGHGPTLLEGDLARFASSVPKLDRAALHRMKAFVQAFVEKNFTPIPADADVTLETWLAGTTYSAGRKEELRQVWYGSAGAIRFRKDFENKNFMKKESYGAYKHARGINSRTDVFKCFTGPYFKLMESEVYKHPAFIKHVPQRQRPSYIMDMLGKFPGPWQETDYSQFEKHFTPDVLHSIEFVLYRHMLQNFPGVYRVIAAALAGQNKCVNKFFTLTVLGRRMSGDMCTSLGNGFTNLMLAQFIAHEKGGVITGVVEGDDGLFFSSVPLTPEDFYRLGFTIKMLHHNDLLRTSFCGLVMSRDLSTMTDPFKVLVNFGWTNSPQMGGGHKVLGGLLRAKALSLAYEHPQCPILSKLAMRVLSQTEQFSPRYSQGWYDQQLIRETSLFKEETARMLEQGPSSSTRRDFAAHYGVPVHIQLEVENEIDRWSCGPLDGPWLRFISSGIHQDARDYHSKYTFCGGGPRQF